MQSGQVRIAAVLVFVSMIVAYAPGQEVSPVSTDRGFYEYSSFGVAHDFSAGWISEAVFAGGYDFNRNISVENGLPAYFVQSTDASSSSTQTSHAIGDWFGRVIFTTTLTPVHYAMAFTATAPTGNQDLGWVPENQRGTG